MRACSPPRPICSSAAGAKATSSRWTRAAARSLWKATVGGVVASGPMTYSVGGRQYVAVAAGSSLFTFALRPGS